jgi:hypothetical protein
MLTKRGPDPDELSSSRILHVPYHQLLKSNCRQTY